MLINSELGIISINDLKKMEIEIPDYQRPYSWGKESAKLLFDDTYKAFEEGLPEYRLGSVILCHKDGESKYSIVDGQQRLTTIAILLYCLDEDIKEKSTQEAKQTTENTQHCSDKEIKETHTQGNSFLNLEYGSLSHAAIQTNYAVIRQKVKTIEDPEKRKKYQKYILENCTLVRIVTDEEQEAFQFFDSQNSRGKKLAPHDLLKAYHLREMDDINEAEKKAIINQWENIKQEDLEELFATYLYPITQWCRCRNGLDYSEKDIGQFKGIARNNYYNYAAYHKASNIYIEQFNWLCSNDLLINTKKLNQFQLTMPLIAGKHFFYYCFHYKDLLEKVQRKLESVHKEYEEIPDWRTGDRHVKRLYECALLFFADKFGEDSINDQVIRVIYSWSYLLRLCLYAVQQASINKYARGKHDKTKVDTNMFSYINDIDDPDDLNTLIFPKPKIGEGNDKRYEKIYEKLKKYNGWDLKENGGNNV